MGDTATTDQTGQIHNVLGSLRSALTGDCEPGNQDFIWRQLDNLESMLSRVLTEHAGMANDLLQVYEQLGVVFEVTRKLGHVGDEREVLRLFVQSLKQTYPNARITVMEPSGDGKLTAAKEGLIMPDWGRQAVARCRDERRVIVADCPNCVPHARLPECGDCTSPLCSHEPIVRVACAPVYAGQSLVCVLVLAHGVERGTNPGCRTFEVSDMLLLESLSVFGGDIIRNFRLMAELRQLSVDMVRTLINAIEQKDEYTSGHTTRVAKYAVMLGKEVGLSQPDLQLLEWSALLHDVGKIGIRDDVLKKPGRLTDEEFEHIKEHPVRSYHVVREVPQLAGALDGVIYHHEHWDGTGYPEGLAGTEIPLQARLIQLGDIFDALTSTRSYRKAFTWEKALSILQEESGKTVDPKLCVVFDRMIRDMARNEPLNLEELMSASRYPLGDSSVSGADAHSRGGK